MKAKIKRLIAIGLSVVSLLSFQQISFAEEKVPEISYENKTGTVVISGGAHSASAEGKIVVEILYPGKSPADLSIFNPETDQKNTDGFVRYLAEFYAEEDGSFKHSFKFSADSGTYPVRIYLANEDKFINTSLEFVSLEQKQRLIEEINNNPSKAEEIIENNIKVLALESAAYNALKSAGGLSGGYEKVIRDIPFAGVEALDASFHKGMLIECYNSSVSNSLLADLTADNAKLLELDGEAVYEDYSKLSESSKEKIFNSMEKSGHEDLSDIKDSIVESAVKYIVINTSVWNQIPVIAKKYADNYKEKVPDLKDIDFDAYNALSSERQYQAMKELLGKQSSAAAIHQWVREFNAACKKWKTEKIPEGPTGGGGGGSPSRPAKNNNSSGGVGNISGAAPVLQNNQKDKENEVKFTDLDTAAWAKEGIAELYKRGIISGRSEEFFDTQSNVTREEFIKILISAFDLISDEDYVSKFTDADKNAWYYKYVACAEKLGVTSGNGDGTFGIGRSITREEMAAMLARTLNIAGIELKKVNEEIDFADSGDISDWAKGSCSMLQKAGIISGMDNGIFEPKSSTTRAQAAMVVYKTLMNK